MKRLMQELNTQDDSFTYTVFGENEPTYKVDSSANLIDCKRGKVIGRYKLSSNAWHLYINDVVIESSPPGWTSYLPEFELKSLTALVNSQQIRNNKMITKMKTANVKVRVKDLRQGVTIYVSHPVYGIDKMLVVGKPFNNVYTNSLFVMVECVTSGGIKYRKKTSLCDDGILPGNSYNGRRTFFKLKHAQAWVDKWSTAKSFQRRHAEHERWCESMDNGRY